MSASAKLAELGETLPQVAAPLAAYVPATTIGNQVWTSGQLPSRDGVLQFVGKVGREVSQEDAVAAARVAMLNALAAAASVAGGLDKIRRVCRVVVYVASDPAFVAQPVVANGASELAVALFGDAGQHVRSAVGVSSLPLDAPVEVELIVEV